MKSFWTVVAMGIGLVACGADSIGVAATVKLSVRGIYADRSSIDGILTLGYAPTTSQNAVVKVGEDEFTKTSTAGSMTWSSPTAGEYIISHTVGDDVLSATYTYTREISTTVKVSVRGIYVDGSLIDGTFTLGYAPTESQKAIVKVNDEEVVNASEAGSIVWSAPTVGEYAISHTVGDDSLEAVYQVMADPVPEITGAADLSAALSGSKDGRLATYLTTLEKYKAYRAWVNEVVGTGADHFGARQAVKDSMLTWFAYALDLSALPEKAPESLTIDTILSAAEGGWDLEVSIGDLTVGSDASAADLGTVFTVEGAADLTDGAFSAENVTTTLSAAGDGKVKVGVEPKSAAGQFFIRVKMTP